MQRVTAPLTSPVKRFGFVVLLVGLALTIIGMIQIGAGLNSYRWFGNFLDVFGNAISYDRYYSRRYPLAAIGPYMLLSGLLLSYLYDCTIGRLLNWIHRG
ncbi:hypothetical protein [Pseudomonas putida]|uniref:hypothetical protein n=1 Tax=Pseudomonas putida TaxID=303 RepID=UPI0018DA0B76|nr:hypothetical protein [Pseudomonas putida]MBH3412552.1 hypothetical protein [Pseudomonas putida]